jgi:winged helix DNA-binding protein
LRRTLFIESAELIPIVLVATRELATRGRERFLAGNGLTPARYDRIAEKATEQLTGRALSARQLRDALGTTEPISPVIIVMCDQARLVRWKGSRGWRSAQPTYRRFDEALPNTRLDTWEERAPASELIDRYVRRYGPVTEADMAWWTGLSTGTLRNALASLPNLLHATIEGSPSVFLIHERDLAAAQQRSDSRAEEISLLPVLDPYLQSYRDRERCVDPPHLPFVVDRGGNSTSVILIGGHVAGVWDIVAKPASELRLFFFGSQQAPARARVIAAASETAEFLTGAPTPVVETEHMTPLTQGTAGSFLSPLKDTP